jgi:hypothetical protein
MRMFINFWNQPRQTVSAMLHKDQAADQRKAAFEWAEISKLLDKYQLWPAKWSPIIKTAIGQKTLGRMATPARAKSASTALYAWRDAIFQTAWNEDDELGTLRRQIWQDYFDWTPQGEDFERPFRFPPSLPFSRGASVCECVFARNFVCVSLSQCLLSLSLRERASERASERSIDRV